MNVFMKKSLILLIISLLLFNYSIYSQSKKTPKPSKFDTLVTISTNYGEIKALLYEKTPKHRTNFFKLVQTGFYKDLLFHRVIAEFMIQGGDPESRNAPEGKMLGAGGVGYQIDAEFNPQFIHKRGAIAAARNNNPQKASSGCQFYIVQGKKVKEEELKMLELSGYIKFGDSQKEIYKSLGGTPFLDQNYTVFGEVIRGMEVVDKIAGVAKDRNDRPTIDVKMNISIQKVSKKKITKLYGYLYKELK
jgi:peptidyl-prolyl cis-trans isomerase B (cyclophilin B)